MKIWLINDYGTHPEHGQFTRNYYFGKELKKLGHDPIVFSGSHPHNTKLQLIEDDEKFRIYKKEPFPWVLIKTLNYEGSKKTRVLSMFAFYKNMIVASKQFPRPDAIIGSSAHPLAALLAIRLSKKFKCKGIVEIRDLWPESIVAYGILGPNNPIVFAMRKFEKWLYIHADAIIFTFAGGYDYIKEQGWQHIIPRTKVHYINNGIDLAQFDYNKDYFTIQDESLENKSIFKVIYTGSIRRVNNLGKLIDIAKQVTNTQVKFLVWGEGDELHRLQERIKKENISNVIFKGHVEKKYVPFITSKANLNIMHNDSKPIFRFGISANKIFDYLAAGAPILCDFYANYNPIVFYNAGLSVDSGDIKDIAVAIDKMADLSGELLTKYGRNARNGANEFDFRNLTKKLIQVIDEA